MIGQAIDSPAPPPNGTMRGLVRQAAEVRLQILRAMGPGKVHHFGGSLSAADLMVALYHYKLRIRPDDPGWPERDRFILSKGHAVPAQYVCLARRGFFPEAELAGLKTLGSTLQGHPDMRKTRGLEANTGSLGMGLSVANGIALAGRVRGATYGVYVLLGDGECQEGQVWEAAMTASQYHLDTVTAIVDRNGLQAMGRTEDLKSMEPLAAKWRAFGWNTLEIDGHDIAAICNALDTATDTAGRPSVIIAQTVKGKGVPFLENQVSSHNVMLARDQYEEAVRTLEASLAALEDAR
jgi:transketolase